jgi:serine/threonine protein kinase
MDDVNTINNNSNEENDEENISMTLGPFQMSHTVLGKGTFGTVYLGTHNKTKEKVAIKEIRKIKFEKDEKNEEVINKKESMYSDLLKQELEIIEKLHHPYICRMLYKVQYNEDWYIVFEYLSGKQFFDNEEIDFTEAKNKKFFCQILSAIEYLHKNNIVHRDIKLENILFDDNEDAKLIDFGLSKYIKNNELLSDKPGSEIYMAPEILLTDDKYDGFLADVWSFGICFYVMKFFSFPFYNKNYNSYSECLKYEKLTFPEDREASPQFKDLIKRILEKDPKKRITLEQIKQHPWVHSVDFNFLKSPGIILTQDVIPIDLEIIREMGLNDEQKIKKIIKDILNNCHNKYTSNYYLRIEQKKKKKIKSIADLRPTSELFINYINSEKSKLKFYNNDINKICEEYTKKIMKQIQDEAIAFGKIKNSIVEDTNKINNENNKNNMDKTKNSNKKNKKMKARSRSFGKFSLLKKYLKEENNANNKLSGQIIKVNKIKLMDKYISPVIFIHGIIDDIIYKVLQSIEDDKKNINDNLKIEVQHPNNIEINQEPEKQIIKNNNFTINLIEEFVYIPAIKNADKTVSYGFYKPKNKNKFQTIKTEETSNEKKIKTNLNFMIKIKTGIKIIFRKI